MTRRRALLGALLGIVLAAGAAAPLAGALDPGPPARDSRVVLPDGRAYVLHTPPELVRDPRRAEGRPAMVFLHGLASNPDDAARSTGLDRLADRDGRLLAYPEGVRDSFGAGTCCGAAVRHRVDDVAFLAAVVEDLRRRGAGRIAVVGFSNGGMMAYRLACDRPGLVDSVGVMSGTLTIPSCRGPVRALHLHGDRDTAVPYEGTAWSTRLRTPLRAVPSVPEAAPGSHIGVRLLSPFPHRWTEPGDPVDASQEFWEFARMDAES